MCHQMILLGSCGLIFTVTPPTLFHTVIDTVQCAHTTLADHVLHEETNYQQFSSDEQEKL